MEVKEVRAALSQLGVDVDLEQAFSLMQRHSSAGEVSAALGQDDFISLLATEFSAATLPRKLGRKPVALPGLASPRTAPQRPSSAAAAGRRDPELIGSTGRLLVGGKVAASSARAPVSDDQDTIDPMGPPALTVEGMQRQFAELERAQAELQRQSQLAIARNGQQLSSLHAQVEELRGRVASQQKRPQPKSRVPTSVEAEQMRIAEIEVNELRRRRDAQRDVVKRRQAQLRELELEISDLRRTTDSAAKDRMASATLTGSASSAALRGAPMDADATEADRVAANAAAEERAERAREQQRVYEHMAKRLRKENSEFNAQFERIQEQVTKEKKQVTSLTTQLAQVAQMQSAAEEKLRGLEKETAVQQQMEREELSAHEEVLVDMRTSVMQLELSRVVQKRGGKKLSELAEGDKGQQADDGSWLSETDRQQASWERLSKRSGLKEPHELLRRAKELLGTRDRLGVLEGQAKAKWAAAVNEKQQLKVSNRRVHDAASAAAERRLLQLTEAVAAAELELEQVTALHRPMAASLTEVRSHVIDMLAAVPGATLPTAAEELADGELPLALLTIDEALRKTQVSDVRPLAGSRSTTLPAGDLA